MIWWHRRARVGRARPRAASLPQKRLAREGEEEDGEAAGRGGDAGAGPSGSGQAAAGEGTLAVPT